MLLLEAGRFEIVATKNSESVKGARNRWQPRAAMTIDGVGEKRILREAEGSEATHVFPLCPGGWGMWLGLLSGGLTGIESLVLGLFADPSYSSVTFSPQRGDRIVMFTDGIVEAKNSGGSEFGVDRVRQILESKHDLPLGRFVDTVLYRLSAWSEHAIGSSQSDDLTLLAIDFNAPDSL